MKTFKISFKLKSSLRTPFYADTIFGHLCWAIRHINGNDFLEEWLKNFKKNPIIISNAFPIGYLPRPVLPLVRLQLDGVSILDQMFLLKRAKKIQYLEENWILNNRNPLTLHGLQKYLFELSKKNEDTSFEEKNVYLTHNTFDRYRGRVLEGGGVYELEEYFFRSSDNDELRFWFLIRTETFDKNELSKFLEYIEFTGFGADKSTGKGQIELESIDEFSFPNIDRANAFISLSNFIPGKPEDLNGYYKTLTKYGKLGGDWASGYLPFKKPVVMLLAGAVIRDDDFFENKRYGKLQYSIHGTNSQIVQFGIAFPLPIYLKENV